MLFGLDDIANYPVQAYFLGKTKRYTSDRNHLVIVNYRMLVTF